MSVTLYQIFLVPHLPFTISSPCPMTLYQNLMFQVLQSLDMLRKASKLNMSELESADCIGALHTLYSMTLTPIGESVRQNSSPQAF